ncbi:c-type cytochrome [Panacibacter ginsenosidivorans]|uniref:C-type cytochrome n=1 Tax=Panacibacter ginsenosidivorans TaxID=1813871 RepID=A0A5B8VEA6_9BACT|nr:di-heme oxidoredictase family protein [Panacibacter ginsenosidivorans]QEC69814.1 c-type cytochrome [Panacibacter ginsenosidivorans]
MKKIWVIGIVVVSISGFTMCNKADVFPDAGYDERLSAGLATVFDETSKAFSHAVEGLSDRDMEVHELGDAAFEQTFVSAPAPVNSGLGPVFNNVSCISCHHNDGKGTPTAGFSTSSMLFRISIPGADEYGGPLAAIGYGGQLQDQAVFGKQPEVHVDINYNDKEINYPDGSSVVLRDPVYTITQSYLLLPAGHMLSPRMAPPVFGTGLLELIPESTILSFADENDKDGDGISGKPNYVYNAYTKETELGRFGLKANNPNLLVQVAGAYNQDMGITSYVFPQESSYGQAQSDAYKDDPELADSILNEVAFYVKTLAVPARRNVTDVTIKEGEQLFNQINCTGCHKQTMQTGVDVTIRQLSNQRIHPYTDLLLHDMGDGLADNRPDFLADGKEWRTTPLWGIGLFQKTNGIPYFLHDGRARTLEEAILWHGGEAEKSKNAFMQLTKTERDKIIKFLNSL